MCSVEFLACRIFEQAIEDYKTLRKNNAEVLADKQNGGRFSIKEIERFFNSSWCEQLLSVLDTNLTGKDIIHKVYKQYA